MVKSCKIQMPSHDQYRFDTTPLSSDPSKVFNLGIYYQGLHSRNFDIYSFRYETASLNWILLRRSITYVVAIEFARTVLWYKREILNYWRDKETCFVKTEKYHYRVGHTLSFIYHNLFEKKRKIKACM